MSTNFSVREVPHYPGSVTCIRAMKVFGDGRIMSPARNHQWTEGENLARCQLWYTHRYVYNSLLGQTISYDEPELEMGREVADLNCQCGFYGYFTPTYASTFAPEKQYTAYAICSAYGKMTVGTQGLRAAKMKIDALLVKHESPAAKTKEEYPPAPSAPMGYYTYPGVRWSLIALSIALMLLRWFVFGWEEPFSKWSFWTVIAVLWVYNIRLFYNQWRWVKANRIWRKKMDEWIAGYPQEPGLSLSPVVLSEMAVTMLKNRYPNIPLYTDIEQMLKDHPLSNPDGIL